MHRTLRRVWALFQREAGRARAWRHEYSSSGPVVDAVRQRHALRIRDETLARITFGSG